MRHPVAVQTRGKKGAWSSRLRMPVGGITVLAMTAVMALDTSDQSAIGATAPEVRAALGVGQTQIGILATSSTLVGVAFTLPFGVLADNARRLIVLRSTVLVWVLAMFAVGAAPNYAVMIIAHSVLGLVTGAAAPLIASVIGDLVPSDHRGRVFSALLLGELFGSVIGLAISGEVAALVGWRWAFWALALTGSLVLILLARSVEPERGRPDAPTDGAAVPAKDQPISLRAAVRHLLHNRTLVLLVLASALGYYFFAGVQTFAVSLLHEAYGVSNTVAPLLVLVVGLSLAIGVLIGGPVGDRLLFERPRSGRLPVLVVAFAGSLAFIVPALISTKLGITMPLLIIGGVLLGTANPPLDATRIDIVLPRLRGRAEAVRTTVKDGADATAPLLFGVAGTAIGLRPTFVLMTVTLGAAFVLCALAIRTYPHDAPHRHAAPSTIPS